MDIFQTTITAIHEIYNITIFIRSVLKKMREQEESLVQIQAKFDVEFAFLVEFKHLFFDSDRQRQYYRFLRPHMARAINVVVVELDKGLANYRLLLQSEGLDIAHLETDVDAVAGDGNTGEVQPQASSPAVAAIRDTIKRELAAKKKELKWALFTQEKLEALVDRYELWSRKLRRVMKLVLLEEGQLGSQTRINLADKQAPALRLGRTAARQIRARDVGPQDDFIPLGGEFAPKPATDRLSSTSYQIGVYTDELGDTFDAVREQHTFDIFDPHVDAQTKRQTRLRLIRSLAWLLTVDNATSSDGDDSDTPLLQCIGYFPDKGNSYPALLYALPPSDPLFRCKTLYDHLLSDPAPALGDRFFIAWYLASTISDIHTSGWVHKGICARGILISPSSKMPKPYLVGWTAARPHNKQLQEGSLSFGIRIRQQDSHKTQQVPSLESQLYMHEERYGRPVRGFESKHDIYSLGVVLLEIGLWAPIGKVFEKACQTAKEKNQLTPYTIVLKNLLKKAQEGELPRAMGQEYGRLVRRCLETNFEVADEEDDEKHTVLISQFQSLVVDRLQDCCSL
ncbi:hypothetical protein DRE_02889 [Drechslerella stenobrocha 248]|uniref:Protein kinase domain-containing protein n=1 Tax=Drechslerella stenobrocha 248 TaxID=1043628 RepID=W7HVY2_9PEZI|nr:hypothetical protein DRE_02889 [Drechslerella stenobrocha 248]